MKRTRATAGRKGGKATFKKHGREFYERIGQKGGKRSGKTRRAMALTRRKP